MPGINKHYATPYPPASQTDRWDSEDDDLEHQDEQDNERHHGIIGISAWGISLIIHACVLALMAFIVFMAHLREDQAPLRIQAIDPPVEQEKEQDRDLIEVDVTIESEIEVEQAVVHELDVPVEELETEDEVVAEVPVKGRAEADAAAEMGGPGAFMMIGAGGGASGAFGNRQGGGRQRAVGRYGGTKASESAVEAALRWFMRHQSGNGQWDVDGYHTNCQEAGPKCEPGTAHTHISGDVACTGYAVLCFLGAGYEHRSANRYQHVVKKGLDWLLATQTADGLLGKRNYEHPVATMALAEAYAMTNDPSLREPTQKAINVILERQTRAEGLSVQSKQAIGDYGLGWDYITPNQARMDSSVSGWNVMALKSAKSGGIDIGNGLDGAKDWLIGAWEAANAAADINTQSLDPYGTSVFPYTWSIVSNKVKSHDWRLTCVGAMSAVFLGYQHGDPILETMANWCYQNQTPKRWPTDTYFMYYNTLTMFQLGDERWRTWNQSVRELLVKHQRRDPACFDGSWDPGGARSHGVNGTGRLLSTAYCTLSLEVYYRYLPLAIKQGQ